MGFYIALNGSGLTKLSIHAIWKSQWECLLNSRYILIFKLFNFPHAVKVVFECLYVLARSFQFVNFWWRKLGMDGVRCGVVG